MADYRKRKKRRKKKKSRKLIMFIFEILLLAVLLLAAYFVGMVNRIDFQNMDESEAGINEDLDANTLNSLEGYTNIALFGLDNRSSNNYDSGNSDVIMIASINNKTKDVKLISVYRDTYLSIGNGKYRKANAAYANGGAKQAVQMLNSNLDLDIQDYVCVDWAAMVEVIDDLGGLDLEITQGEMQQINKYKWEVDKATGLVTPDVTQYGMVHLDGTQATTYARIRKLAGDDFKRASRQRIVLQAILEKAKKADLATLTNICNSVVDDISTTLSLSQIISLAKDVKSYKIASTTGFPFELTTKSLPVTNDTVIPADLATNVKELHEYMFDDRNYVPSQTVQTISDTIVNSTGITTESALINTSDYNETAGAVGTDGLKKSTEEN
ncbi:MAG: LCP family protein [Lachnospiraceae bacterium]|nr:LCP family protein [Agathobacter sp.]MDD6290473.1 LCP family protein [Lachnospiraceae bacterium]